VTFGWIFLLGVFSASAEPRLPEVNILQEGAQEECEGRSGKLVLVNWSSQTPRDKSQPLGTVQADALKSVSEFLFQSENKLEECDRVLVFPEGVEKGTNTLEPWLLANDGQNPSNKIDKLKWAYRGLEAHLATDGVRSRPHAFEFQVGSNTSTARRDFERSVCEHVLAPTIRGFQVRHCKKGGGSRLRGHVADPRHQRAVSRYYLSLLPELMLAFDSAPSTVETSPTEVVWIWAGTGFRDYETTLLMQQIDRDFEPAPEAEWIKIYYESVSQMFSTEKIQFESDLVQFWRVALKPSDPDLWNGGLKTAEELDIQWKNPESDKPAQLTHYAKWIGFSSAPSTWKSLLGSGIRWLVDDAQSKGLNELPTPSRWRLSVRRGLEIASVTADFKGEAVRLAELEEDRRHVSIANVEELKQQLLVGIERWVQSDDFDATGDIVNFELSTELHVLPVNQELRKLTESLGKKDVVIRRELKGVKSPTITVTYGPISTVQWKIFALVSAAAALAFGLLWWAVSRKRELDVEVDWGEVPREIDLALHRDRAVIELPFRVQVTDPTPFWARRANIDIAITLRTYTQPEIPLHAGKEGTFQELNALDGTVVVPSWEENGSNAFKIQIRRPTNKALRDQPLTLLTRHDVIDFARVGTEKLKVMVVIELSLQPKKHYLPVSSTIRVRELCFTAVPGPASPLFHVDIFTQVIARHLALELQGASEGQWNRNCRVNVGTIELCNPAAARFNTLPVRFRVTHGSVKLQAKGSDSQLTAQLLIDDKLESDTGVFGWEVACHPASAVSYREEDGLTPALLALGIEFPMELRDHKANEWVVSIAIAVEFCDFARPDEWQAFSQVHRQFNLKTAGEPRIVCLDFGTSATRMLLQDQGLDNWGYLPLGRLLAKGSGEEPANLPSNVFLADDRVQFGKEASQSLAMWDPKKGDPPYVDSIKELLLEGDARAVVVLERVVRGLFAQGYQPTVDSTKGVPVYQDSTAGLEVIVELQPGERQQLVAMLPNDAAPLYANALERILNEVFPGTVRMMREAEGVALWYGAEAFDLGLGEKKPAGKVLRILVFDVGAGTTDVALVEVHRPETRQMNFELPQQRTRILSTGGARVGGRDVDEALFNAAAKVSKVDLSWADLAESVQWGIRPRIEKDKIALSRGLLEQSFSLSHHDTGTAAVSASYKEILQHPIYGDLLARMVREPLAVLIGRRVMQDLSDVDRVVVSGRGAQTYDFVRTLKYVLNSEFGVSPDKVNVVEKRFLKAAVTMGARLFSLGLCGDFVPSDLSHRNRVLLLTRDSEGRVSATELLEPGRSFGGGSIVGDWTHVQPWEAATLITTWLCPDFSKGEGAPAWLLTPRRISAVLRGEPLQEIAAASPYTKLDVSLDALANRAKRSGGLELRACVGLSGEVTLETRKDEKNEGMHSK
jgi:hypothetical protein